jgi:RHS repeat-associated protein
VQRYDLRGDSYEHGAWDEYWYDALGRRVLVRARRETALCNAVSGNECVSFVQRTVWDGSQVLYEERTSGLDAVTGGAPSYGTVGYVHALGIDQPVALMDGRVIHYNWRGLGEASSWSDGTPADYELATGSSTRVAWPAGQGVYYRRATDPYAGIPVTWIGSLAVNGQDGTSLLYRRNRYYDPASGRFTQEDPIGLAGGLNLYGFAGGDPVNFSDPFGLCAWHEMECWNDKILALGATGGAVARYASAAASLALELTGAVSVDEHARGAAGGSKMAMAALIFDIGVNAIPGGGEGRAALSRLIKDASENPGAWRVVGAFTEAATNKAAKGGLSVQTVLRNEAGDQLVRHTVLDQSGKVIEEHYRPIYKPRDVDKP